MEQILLRDYESVNGRYKLDISCRDVAFSRKESLNDAQKGARGLAAKISIGLWPQEQVLFALYTLNNHLFLYAGDKCLDLTQRIVSVKRTCIFPFVKRFAVYSDCEIICAWTYWYTDLLEDGLYVRDFLLYITQILNHERERAKFIYFWDKVSKGSNPVDISFQKELERFLADNFEQD